MVGPQIDFERLVKDVGVLDLPSDSLEPVNSRVVAGVGKKVRIVLYGGQAKIQTRVQGFELDGERNLFIQGEQLLLGSLYAADAFLLFPGQPAILPGGSGN